MNLCVTADLSSNNLINLQGNTTVYLISNLDNTGYTVIDSLTLNFVNLTHASLFYSLTPTVTPVGYQNQVQVSITPLDAQQTYTIDYLYLPSNNTTNFNNVPIPSNSTTYNYTSTANSNTSYGSGFGSMHSTCPNGVVFNYSININSYATNTPTCPIYVDGSLIGSAPTPTFCLNDTVFYTPYNVIASGLQPNEVITIYANFGDGTGVKTATTLASSTGTFSSNNTLNLFNHYYTAPGSYSIKVWATAPSVCYMDTVYMYFNVSNNICGKVKGIVYYDANTNCVCDVGEARINNMKVTIWQGSSKAYAWTDMNGDYAFTTAPSGIDSISVDFAVMNYTASCANSLLQAITVNTITTTNQNFGLICSNTQTYNDAVATGVTLHGAFFSGDSTNVYPHFYSNFNFVCTSSVTSTWNKTIVLPPCLTYKSGSSIPPDTIIQSIFGDTLIWNSNNLYDIPLFTVNTCTNLSIGDTLCITEIVNFNNLDANPANNSSSRCFAVGVAYDPNYKEVSPQGIGAQGYIPATTQDLTYTIHFQNTGTAPAHNIFVLDTISQYLDASTIKILESSHAMQPYWLPNNTIKFMFANIMLPDSSHNEPQSHGYISYKIKPKANLANGIEIKNKGYIYFDYNSPIVTNTALNTIGIPSNTGFKEASELPPIILYPNPVNNLVHIQCTAQVFKQIKVVDVVGKVVQNITNIDTNDIELNTSKFTNGSYFIEMTTSSGNKYVKKIIKISTN